MWTLTRTPRWVWSSSDFPGSGCRGHHPNRMTGAPLYGTGRLRGTGPVRLPVAAQADPAGYFLRPNFSSSFGGIFGSYALRFALSSSFCDFGDFVNLVILLPNLPMSVIPQDGPPAADSKRSRSARPDRRRRDQAASPMATHQGVGGRFARAACPTGISRLQRTAAFVGAPLAACLLVVTAAAIAERYSFLLTPSSRSDIRRALTSTFLQPIACSASADVSTHPPSCGVIVTHVGTRLSIFYPVEVH